MYFIYFNGEFYYSSDDTHYKHGTRIEYEGETWWPTLAQAQHRAQKLNGAKPAYSGIEHE